MDRGTGRDPHPGAQTEDRIEHGADRVRQHASRLQRVGIGQPVAPPEEVRAVGLVLVGGRILGRQRPCHNDPVSGPQVGIVWAALAPGRKQEFVFGVPMGLHEQFGKGRMAGIRGC